MWFEKPSLVCVLCVLCVLQGVCCRAAPQSLGNGAGTGRIRDLDGESGRRLHGRFLHITDVHPDPFYKTYSSTEEDAACHRKRGPAGVYGAETSGCDTPLSLVNETFKWIHENLADSIDFVIWTGDSARHDNDEKIPRTQEQVIRQNEFLVQKFAQVFGTEENKGQGDFRIPIVPTFGNNDIMPHNIFLEGPNKWTLKYLDIWRSFVPEEQRHQFQQGGWFYVEVIPKQLAVISLNTLYFFDSNSGVDGCANKHEPGYEHMEWLRIQLQILRERGMKAILMGHVPPARVNSKESWDETCWQKFTLWQRQYRDIIVGSLFGHMNIDHFMIHDFKDIKKSTKKGSMSAADVESTDFKGSMYEDGEITVASASGYLLDLRNAWAKLPVPEKNSKPTSIQDYMDTEVEEESTWQSLASTVFGSKKAKKGGKDKDGKKKKKYTDKIGGKYAERYSVALVSPSVVPNYFPTLRVVEYNITGLEDLIIPFQSSSPPPRFPNAQLQTPVSGREFDDDTEWENRVQEMIEAKKKKNEKDARKKPKKWKFKIPSPPPKGAPPGPAYLPQLFTLKSYTQYFANLTHINNDFIEPTIFIEEKEEDVEDKRWKEGKHRQHQGKKPKPKPHPKKFKFEVEYNTTDDKLFKLKDLTVRSFVNLARKIGQDAKSKTVEAAEDDIENGFGDNLDDDHEQTEEDDSGDDIEAEKKGKKDKKHKKHKHGTKSAWFTFVRRAFVGTMDPRDIDEQFCQGVDEEVEEQGMEL
ncbi:Endopolyphosphatase [Amniculicola lignicola CBS 123094]|uniref:Endopolyphosphatase n=1 Tax=Amniculicola lignicola CBS 123094 TaxID=1392246 RepID=A0A6A5WWA1_9PLEO|nr:Endopolyphosphatase [Amniculicola lignicola CBS 123094]